MADIKSPEERSRNMAAIKGKNTKPEVYLRKLLFAKGFRYRTNSSKVPGHPDIWLRKYNAAIYVNGCFWHRHTGCKYAYIPKSRMEFWNSKFEKNVLRDLEVRRQLKASGIKCLVVWECSIKKMIKQDDYRNECIGLIEQFLTSQSLYEEI
jgi:DNA mismatch endonuclease (patch repair protein)